MLDLENINMCQNINKPNHFSGAYDTQNLVVRRGQEFVVRVSFNRALVQQDDFQLEFLIGESGSGTGSCRINKSQADGTTDFWFCRN
uniref:Transglutaminase N-terminal domain-containing protein n=1 Tax=Stegastes partitus TaxID=144197 RepID=A0A3B4ZKW4_9TELE